MARAWRIEYEGAYYHLLFRGNERRDIFLSDEDRNLFLDTIGECGERFEIDIFSDKGLRTLIRQLNSQFTH